MPGREEFKREYLESIAETCSKPFAECSRMERYTALAAMIRECCSGVRAETLRRPRRRRRKDRLLLLDGISRRAAA